MNATCRVNNATEHIWKIKYWQCTCTRENRGKSYHVKRHAVLCLMHVMFKCTFSPVNWRIHQSVKLVEMFMKFCQPYHELPYATTNQPDSMCKPYFQK